LNGIKRTGKNRYSVENNWSLGYKKKLKNNNKRVRGERGRYWRGREREEKRGKNQRKFHRKTKKSW